MPRGVYPRSKNEFVSTVTGEASETVDAPKAQPKAEYLAYTGKGSVPDYDEKLSEKYRCRYFVVGNAGGNMKLIRVYRGGRKDEKGAFKNGSLKRKLVRQFKPEDKKRPGDRAFYEMLKKAGVIRF